MAGCPPGALAAGHIEQIDALVTAWRGQRGVDLPGRVQARRRDGTVWFISSGPDRVRESFGRT
jgi:tRNA(Ile)-lysidine synthase